MFDRSAAITRSLLGYGVLAGAVYLAVGITLGVSRTGSTSHRPPPRRSPSRSRG